MEGRKGKGGAVEWGVEGRGWRVEGGWRREERGGRVEGGERREAGGGIPCREASYRRQSGGIQQFLGNRVSLLDFGANKISTGP
jgi:hypothetical protein